MTTRTAARPVSWLRLQRGTWADYLPILLVTAAVVALGWVQDDFQLVRSSLWIIYGLLALSLDLVWGRVGIFSFGQTAFFGLAGYAYGAISINLYDRTGESTTAILGGIVVGAVVAAALGYFMFYGRVSDVYLAIITLAFTLVLLTFFASTADPKYHIGDAQLGGYNGMVGVLPIVLGIPNVWSKMLTIRETYLFLALTAGAIFLLLQILLRSPFGRVLRAVRENELRTELLGYDTRRYKLLAFSLGGAIAGLAGAAYAAWGYFINPAVFSLTQAAMLVIWVLVGGRGTLVGAFLGVVLVEWASTELGARTTQTPLFLGALLILIVLLVPNGLVSLIGSVWRRITGRRRSGRLAELADNAVLPATHGISTLVQEDPRNDAPVLETRDLSMAFGGLRAVDGVTVSFGEGLHCLIGPNGAGKSTFFNLLVGRYRPTAGQIVYRGRDITRLEPHQRAGQGIGIKLQVPSIYPSLTVEENVWLSAYARTRDAKRATAQVGEVLGEVGLRGHATMLAAHLSHGQQQWLEIGMVLAAHPEVILLDEPTAGMTREESVHTAGLVKTLSERATVVVVEHNMEFVRQLAAPVTVLHQGQVFKRGSLEELRQDEAVLDIYLVRRSHAERS